MNRIKIQNLLLILLVAMIISCNSNTKNKSERSPITTKEISKSTSDSKIHAKSATKVETKSTFNNKLFREISELPEFKEYKGNSGASIDDNFAIAQYKSSKHGNNLVVFERIKHQGSAVKYSIIDTLIINSLSPNHFIGFGECRLNGKLDREIIVVFENQENVEYFTKIKKAWRANRKSLKITPIDVKGIDFTNEGYGI